MTRHGFEHRLDALYEVEGVRIEELVLLLDAERVRVAGAERVIEDARLRLVDVSCDRGRECLLAVHPSTASTSISTFQAGSRSAVTTVVFAGRTSRNTSP